MIEELFDDDILIDDSSSVFNNTGVESLTNLIENNIIKFKNNIYLNMKGDGYVAWCAYLDETKGVFNHGYWDCFSYKVNNPYSVTLKLKSLNGFKYHNGRSDYRLGIIDVNLFRQIPNVTNIELEPIYNDKTKFNDIIFMQILRYKDKTPNIIDNKFVDNLKNLIEIRSEYQIKYNITPYIVFQECSFNFDTVKYLNDNLPGDLQVILCDCGVLAPPEKLDKLYPNNNFMGFAKMTVLEDMCHIWTDCNKIKFYTEPIFKRDSYY